jgi:hypothetical protein
VGADAVADGAADGVASASMTASESLAAIRVKIEGARDHLRDLRGQVGAFLAMKPYEVGAKRDPNTRKPIYFVARVSTTPATLPVIAGDVLQNLRSALDHLAYRLEVVGLGNAPPDPRYIAYPITDVEAEYVPYATTGSRQLDKRQGTPSTPSSPIAVATM